eukprot:CAMPEP_0197825020 /NCGR_PEP_ID=MMETSP1437-20131217/2170_1 /TAXON_ID=49252 ORGANISM="Eucampia antarctica, Strain CCMP1452" /NCGR_SAMPLE_ID=MMETSP1437 /ASSEMBLY_ACC=CAM_ASM_001096 /LENGTH=141 /DNA_ID=CAMNT_0043424853 /DNA_START=103 /DNA_END=528 /DNA_ORIENTATION=-
MVHADAVRAMDMAAKGKASGSLAKAAVPSPCAAAPMPNPRATASVMPNASKMAAPKLAPMSPVITTMDTARDTSAPSIPAMAMAKGEVIFLDNKLSRNIGLAIFKKRTNAAVPNKPPTDDTVTAVPTSAKFCFMILLRSYI